jgi:LacI family transcriptional regulator
MSAVAAAGNTAIDILDFPKIVMGPSLDAAKTVVAALLSLAKRPTALYAYSDDFALPLMRALHEAGFSIPRDIAVLGTDDLPYGELSIPSLSTIRFDEDALGERAVALINSLITGESAEARFFQEPEPYLIRREST